MKERIVLFGGSFNPPHKAHRTIAEELTEIFDLVYVIPCGMRSDKPSANMISLAHRKEMAKLAFSGLKKVELDLYDLEHGVYTPTYRLQERYEKLFPGAEIWHLIGEDIIVGGCRGNSEIQRVWDRGNHIWRHLNFLVITRPGYGAEPEDLPPHAETIEIGGLIGSGTFIRQRIEKCLPIDDLVDPAIAEYIKKNRLYKKN